MDGLAFLSEQMVTENIYSHGWDMPQCRVCRNYNGYKYFKRREGDKNE